MSGFTKAGLKLLAKDDDLTTKLLANEVLTLREINAEIRKDGRRAAEVIIDLRRQLEELQDAYL